MKLEAGKYYRTRDGKKAYVGHILPEEIAEGNRYLVRGYLLKESGWCNESWSIEGWYHPPKVLCSSDLVAEWTEIPEYSVRVDAYDVNGRPVTKWETVGPSGVVLAHRLKSLSSANFESMVVQINKVIND